MVEFSHGSEEFVGGCGSFKLSRIREIKSKIRVLEEGKSKGNDNWFEKSAFYCIILNGGYDLYSHDAM